MVELKHIDKSYDGKTNVIEDLNLTIHTGELVVLVGESGCGKTTTMKMINRLVEPTRGSILLHGEDIQRMNKNELRRNIGYVIQNIGLFPHRTIAENISTVPLLCKKDKAERLETAKSLMDIMGLPYEKYGELYPSALSGGQQQRVGVARALANDPDLILMDEPFSALDPITREQLQDELLRLHDELGKTIVFVTHDIDEAIKLGDKIAVMQGGKVIQFDRPETLLKNPVNEFVAQFIGKKRLWNTPDMLKAEDVMDRRVVSVSPNRSVAQAIELMRQYNTPVLAVLESDKREHKSLLGVVGTNRIRAVTDDSVKMRDLMKSDIIKIPHDMCLTEVLHIRTQNDILFSPVVDADGILIGMITNTSILSILGQIIPGKEEY